MELCPSNELSVVCCGPLYVERGAAQMPPAPEVVECGAVQVLPVHIHGSVSREPQRFPKPRFDGDGDRQRGGGECTLDEVGAAAAEVPWNEKGQASHLSRNSLRWRSSCSKLDSDSRSLRNDRGSSLARGSETCCRPLGIHHGVYPGGLYYVWAVAPLISPRWNCKW